jgi:enoyl-CoA hydratase/carnithine racemase
LETLIVEREAGVVSVTMNRPQRKNAANVQMATELQEVFEEVQRRTDDRVLVLTGAEGSFCSGADLSDPNGLATGDEPSLVRMRKITDMVLALHRLTVPAIAKVDGVCVGLGLGLALGCDLVVASDRARFSAIFARRALSVDTGLGWLLPRVVGMAKAKELALLADIVEADQALAMGLVNKVVPVDDLDAAAGQWSAQLAAGATLALGMTKRILNDSFTNSMATVLEDEARCQSINFTTEDFAEAMAAFGEKREARYTGR